MYETHHAGREAPSRTLSLRYYKLLTLRSRFLSPSHLRAHTHTPTSIHTLTEHTPASAGRRERVPLHKLTLLAVRDMEES
ncbi:hypothetical protein GQ607_001275 [Colletotrichum asianum]|uniref:Uncharacterized protein n=1 Tax=Colletotrichum asianum TaxID=702518 RepID=A0A8H3WQ69_9PEZI|nr:hypothetical protein GQ607_001275 [Colletotrichum asianum]